MKHNKNTAQSRIKGPSSKGNKAFLGLLIKFLNFYFGKNGNLPVSDENDWSLDIRESGSELYTQLPKPTKEAMARNVARCTLCTDTEGVNKYAFTLALTQRIKVDRRHILHKAKSKYDPLK